MQISAVKNLVINDGVAPCPSHGSIVNIAKGGFNRILYLAALFLSGDVKAASTLPYQPYLVLYLVLEHFFRDHQNHGPDWLRKGYLVLYLTDPFSPETLIIGMLLPPLLDVHIPTPKISRIRLDPSPLALPLTLDPAFCLPTTLLGLPGPRIRPIIPAAVETPLLSSLCWFHKPILDKRCLCQLREAYQGIKRN